MKIFFLKSAFLIQSVLFLAEHAAAQSALDGYDPNADGRISVAIVQPDGKLLIGGDFTSLSPNGGPAVTRNRIARLNPDGTLDTAFNPNASVSGGPPAHVACIVLQPDGKILVGGRFTSIGGQMRNNIARLDAITGAADVFDPNAQNSVNSIALQADGKILVGGFFNGVGGQARLSLARLDPSTGLADSFDANMAGSPNVLSIVVQSDGKILVGGRFTSIGGQIRSNIARLDPITALPDSFNPSASGPPPDIYVSSIVIQPDDRILVGGDFTNIGGQSRHHIARLDPISGLADLFNPSPDNIVSAIALQPDGKVLTGGAFTNIAGQMRNHIARLDGATGSADSFDPNASATILAIALQSDGKILAGGDFTTLAPNGGAIATRNHIARLEIDGRSDQTLNLNVVGNYILAIAVQPDGKILIGGLFNTILGVQRNSIARLNADGTLDTSFNPNANSVVYSIVVQGDGKILVGGYFTNIGGQNRNRIARLDSATGSVDSFNPDANSAVDTIAVQSDGKILVGGIFTSIGGQPRNYIARLDASTGLADSFNPNANNSVSGLAIQTDGKIVAAGDFSTIGGQGRFHIARLDPSTGLVDSFDPHPNDGVNAIAIQTDGKILVAGSFTAIGGQMRGYMARLDPKTGVADSFDPNANSWILAIAGQADGKTLVGGYFHGSNSIGGQTRNYIARLDPATGLADSFDPNASFFDVPSVYAIAVQTDGKVLVSGAFQSIGGQARNLFARLSNDSAALQNLAARPNSITWTRGGSSPELNRVIFDYSTDNMNYTFLGSGMATGSNWSLTGLNFPNGQAFYVRARGYYRDSNTNASESITESVRNVFIMQAPTPSQVV